MRTGRPVGVLVVDDDPEIRRILRLLLEQHGGFDVVGEAGDGETAVSAARRVQPGIVLLDLRMPIRSGADALPAIQAVAPCAMVAVVSAAPAADHRDELLALGAFTYYEKTRVGELPELLATDYAAFVDALNGGEIAARWTIDR